MNQLNILLFNPNYDAKTLTYSRMSGLPLGLISIATYLNKNGHKAKIVDRFYCKESFPELYEKNRPDIVGIALMSNTTITDAVDLSRYFMSKGIPVVMGGTYASIIPEMILGEKAADCVIIGEGEETWLELADAFENRDGLSNVSGVYYSDESGTPVYTGDREFIDLGKLGPCDFTLIDDIPRYFQTSYCYDKMLYLYMSKGCTGNCAFCFNHFFHRCTLRTRPVGDFFDEVEYLIKNCGLKTVYFSDELWGFHKQDREDFFREKKERGLNFIWGCQTRIGVLKEEDIREMYDNGCRWIMFGIEAPPGHLAEIANKKIRYDLIEPTLESCNRIGMLTNISFIINYPHSTEEDLRDTVKFALSLSPSYYSIHYFYPLDKSILYDRVVEEKLFTPPETLKEASERTMSEFIISSFSDVPDIDFKVIRSCFLLNSILSKTPKTDEKRASFTSQAIKSVFINAKDQGFVDMVKGIYFAGKYFVTTVSDVVLHPGTVKKYGFKFKLSRKK